MKTIVIIVILLILTGVLVVSCGSGCSTWDGFGKDVEKTGEAIQDSSK